MKKQDNDFMYLDALNQRLDKIKGTDFDYLAVLSHDRSPSIRSEVARTLAKINDSRSETILLHLLQDKNILVRIEAADSLSSFCTFDVYHSLLNIAETENYYLLKGYAVLSLAQVGLWLAPEHTTSVLLGILKTERRFFVKLSCYEGLYCLGLCDYLYNIFLMFNTNNYRNRCAVISSLEQLLNKSNREQISFFLKEKLSVENTLSVKDKIIELLREIEP